MLYYFLLGLQGVTTLVVFLEFLYLYTQGNSHRRTILMILTQAAWINNAGYFVEILASTKEAALIGTRISYLGKSFIPFMILMLATPGSRTRSGPYSLFSTPGSARWSFTASRTICFILPLNFRTAAHSRTSSWGTAPCTICSLRPREFIFAFPPCC